MIQADAHDQAQPSNAIIAGEDAKLRINSYPVDQEEQDICIDARVSTSDVVHKPNTMTSCTHGGTAMALQLLSTAQ